jgi:protein ImuA
MQPLRASSPFSKVSLPHMPENNEAYNIVTPNSYTPIALSSPLPPIQFGIPEIDSALPNNGLQRGAIHEIFYHDPLLPKSVAKTIPAILAYNAQRSALQSLGSSRVVWIGRDCWLNPAALAALGAKSEECRSTHQNDLVDSLFKNSLFIDPPNEVTTLWAIDTALRSAGIDLVIAAIPRVSRVTTQRLSFSARRYSTTALLLRSYQELSSPSAAASRWVLSPTQSNKGSICWNLSLAKLKSGLSIKGNWIILKTAVKED